MTRLALLAFATVILFQGWEIPEQERAVENPVDASPDALAAGEASYRKQCLMCHGDSFDGKGPAVAMFAKQPPDLSTAEARERLTDGEIFYKMTIGRNPMPAMESKLSEEERWRVVHYVRTLQAE